MKNLLEEHLIFEEGISKCSSALLKNHPDAPNLALQYILEISKACRIYIFENFLNHTNDLCMKQTYEICAEGVTPQIEEELLQSVSYEKENKRWRDILSKNEYLIGDIENFPQNERDILEPQGIKSILVLPIFTGEKWFGFIGFDYTNTVKVWSNWDLSLLKVGAELFGAYFQNIAHLKKIQDNNDKLVKLIESRDRFIQILAHDLRNPLASTAMLSDLLLKNNENYNNNKKLKLIGAINRSAQNSYDLMEDLLMWAKTQRQQMTFSPEIFNLTNVCDTLTQDFKITATAKKIRISCQHDKNILVFSDPNLLKTILRNLISNAIKFTNNFGTITITITTNKDKAVISVKDTGIGIPKDILDSIGNSNTSNKGTEGEVGTGVGLRLCKELIECQGETIEIKSTVNEGTTFIFTLPLHQNI